MATLSATYLNKLIPRILADKALAAPRPFPVMLPLVNQYSIAGMRSPTLRLNRWADHGPATTATEGVAFATTTDWTLASPVDLTPLEAAVMRGRITDDAVAMGSGYVNALELFQSNDVNALVAVLQAEATSLMSGVQERLERDLANLFVTATNTVGALTADCTLAVLEQALFVADTLEQPNNLIKNRTFVLGPRGVSDVRVNMQPLTGTIWGGVIPPLATTNTAGPVGMIWQTPIVQLSQTVVPTSGIVPGTGGHIGALILRGVGNPEQDGGSGEVGSIAFCEKVPPTIASDFVLLERSADIMIVHKYAAALRAQDLIVGVLYDDA